MESNLVVLLAILSPIIGALVVYFVSKAVSETAGAFVTVLVAAVTAALTISFYPVIAGGDVIYWEMFRLLPAIPLTLYVDTLGMHLGLIASVVWVFAALYSVEYMIPEHAKTRFNVFFLLSLGGMMGIVFTGNLFTLFFFFEFMAIVSYVLVVHEEDEKSVKAGFKYLFMGIVGGLILLLAIIATHEIAGTTDLTGTGLAALQGNPNFVLIFWAFILGFAVKAGMFPVHVWLPDAHPVAPTPASALLSGVMIKAGAYGMIRTVYAIFGSEVLADFTTGHMLLILGVITMLLGSGCAIMQKEIKRLLAFSSVAQIGYIVIGIALLSPTGLTGAVLHIFNHAITKGTLFMCAGAIIYKTGLRQLSDLKGIGQNMPVTMVCFTLAAISMVGLPPFAGFISKWTLAQGSLQAAEMGILSNGAGLAMVGAFLLSSLLNAVYYGPIVIAAWFGGGDHGDGGHGAHAGPVNPPKPGENVDPTLLMLLPMSILALGTLFFGLFPTYPLGMAETVAKFYFGL